jgi:hydroxymethylglutaryl-CoA synthase
MTELSPASNALIKANALPSDAQLIANLPTQLSTDNKWSGFFKKTQTERRQLIKQCALHDDQDQVLDQSLPANTADLMVENCIGVCGLPLGVVPTFVLNGRNYIVPMCVEEPSVIAAAASAAKLIAESGGFAGASTSNTMIGQIQVVDFEDEAHIEDAVQKILERKEELISQGNLFCQSMLKRGGGVVDVSVRRITGKRWIVVHLHIDVCEAMGANIVNTVVEGVGPWVGEVTRARVGLKILSNLCTGRRTKVCFRIPLQAMSWKGVKGEIVAERIVEAWEFADSDPYRATTNNKGIMNGVDAVAIATGQDWRAIEAAAHAYASISGKYTAMARYYIDSESSCFIGSMEIPISVGTKGGALQSHPTYKLAHELLGNPDAQELSQIIVGIGLAQNFAAMRALAIEGIQKGHMALHARNIAISAGCPEHLVPQVAAYMQFKNSISKATAEEYIKMMQVQAKDEMNKL